MNRILVAVAVMLAAGAASGASGGTATPAGFGLVLDGRHRPDLTHEGTFTTSASFCPSGAAVDLTETTLHTVLGEFACAGSTDSFTAQVSPTPAEHGGTGSWKIVAGKGALATLRGKGTWTSVRLSGSDADPASITFRSTWHGVTDFDVAAPTLGLSKVAARKLRRPKRTYLIRCSFSLQDAGGTVAYAVKVVDPTNLNEATKRGATAAGSASVALRIRPTKRARKLRLTIDATDPVGNATRVARTLRIR
jgi:hypothetical protein